ncbi:MAG: hypothetical protein FJY17_11170 [Bacteroidetes bacterium]|nr:hypothetical protein [Bacteroidota bacterium]
MAKAKGTKHHMTIKLEDLNKMFKDSQVIPIPKSFVRNIEFLLSAHNVSLDEMPKDVAVNTIVQKNQKPEEKVAFQTTDFND